MNMTRTTVYSEMQNTSDFYFVKKSFHVVPALCHVASPSHRYEKASLHGRYGERDGPV